MGNLELIANLQETTFVLFIASWLFMLLVEEPKIPNYLSWFIVIVWLSSGFICFVSTLAKIWV